MNQLSVHNKSILKLYVFLARCVGWSLLLLIPCAIHTNFVSYEYFMGTYSEGFSGVLVWLWVIVRCGLYSVLPVLFALLISQLIRYVTEPGYHYGWVLRYADKILYVYAVVLVLVTMQNQTLAFGRAYYGLKYIISFRDFMTMLTPLVVPVFVAGMKVFVLVGLAQILKRVLPVIEEHKALV